MDEHGRAFLACPRCGAGICFEWASEDRANTPRVVSCPACPATFASADGMIDLCRDLAADSGLARAHALADYESFCRARKARGLRDAYAAFRPFNESSRLLDSFLERLPTRGVLVDTWARTPWMGLWIAGHRPGLKVISIWEGELGLLGIEGYRHWLHGERRPRNFHIVFADLRKRWPFADASIDCVHGLDTLHRYGVEHVLAEATRVAKIDAPIVFPHIHLSDRQPRPFFDRGCDIRSSQDYRLAFEALPERFAPPRRRWWILPEASSFRRQLAGLPMLDEHAGEEDDYNAFVISTCERVEPRLASPASDTVRATVNPLLEVVDEELRVKSCEATREFLSRHPCYRAHLESKLPAQLGPEELATLRFMGEGYSAAESALIMGRSPSRCLELVARLGALEALRAGPLPPGISELHAFFDGRCSSRRPLDFEELWQTLESRYEGRALMSYADGSDFFFEDVDRLVQACIRWLCARTSPGERVAIVSAPRPELYILIWACLRSSRVVVPVDSALPTTDIEARLAATQARVSIGDHGGADLHWNEKGSSASFEDMLAEHLDGELPDLPPIDTSADALVLFTSGSSGTPKGVRLSQRSLLATGHRMAADLGWLPDDRLLCPDAPHSMSGFRNPVIAALCGGCELHIACASQDDSAEFARASSLGRLAAIWSAGCTLATTVPAEASTWSELATRDARRIGLRQLALTGYATSPELRARLRTDTRLEVISYYGLTETGGYCLARRAQSGNLGLPRGASLRVVDECGVTVASGEVGELLVCSAGLMNGYLVEPSEPTPEGGWLHTGDLVQLRADGSIELVGRGDSRVKAPSGEFIEHTGAERPGCELDDVRGPRLLIHDEARSPLDTPTPPGTPG